MVCVCVCVCVIRLMCLRVVSLGYCVMLYGVLFFLCDCCVFACVLFHVSVGVVCDLLCGDACFFLCVSCLFVSVPWLKNVSFVVDCVMLYGLFLL